MAIVHDAPWEGASSYYHSVFQDGDLYRMYYRGCNWNDVNKKVHEVICHAQNRDGIHWTKPELGLIPFKGSTENDLVWSIEGPVKFPSDIWRVLPASVQKLLRRGGGARAVRRREDQRAVAGAW